MYIVLLAPTTSKFIKDHSPIWNWSLATSVSAPSFSLGSTPMAWWLVCDKTHSPTKKVSHWNVTKVGILPSPPHPMSRLRSSCSIRPFLLRYFQGTPSSVWGQGCALALVNSGWPILKHWAHWTKFKIKDLGLWTQTQPTCQALLCRSRGRSLQFPGLVLHVRLYALLVHRRFSRYRCILNSISKLYISCHQL